ncbi:MAG: hypothetical protein LBH43_08435 [Treponema sp.]|jgi:hypothetical protein|nr:hypothetical protein [Treponema sp.]
MRIDAIFPLSNNFNTPPITAFPVQPGTPNIAGTLGVNKQDSPPRQSNLYYPAIAVEISPEGWETYNKNIANKGLAYGEDTAKKNGLPGIPKLSLQGGSMNNGVKGINDIFETHECQTCKSRKYQDSSSDPSVSFQAPTHLSPGQAAGSVAAHESEHVSHEQAKADREDRKIISQSVTINTAICPECGRVYVSGGVTRTITANKQDFSPSGDETE